jgi:hypothetical protein
MTRLNDYFGSSLDKHHQAEQMLAWDGATVSYTTANLGYVAGLDGLAKLGIRQAPGLSFGFRAAYLQALQAVFQAPYIDTRVTLDSSLVPLMLGLRYDQPLAWGFSAYGEAFAGVGMANATLGTKVLDFQMNSWMSGTDFTADLGAGLRWQYIAHSAAILKVSWRQAHVSQMLINRTDLAGGSSGQGQVWADIKGKPIDLDFSGLTLGGGMEIILF